MSASIAGVSRLSRGRQGRSRRSDRYYPTVVCLGPLRTRTPTPACGMQMLVRLLRFYRRRREDQLLYRSASVITDGQLRLASGDDQVRIVRHVSVLFSVYTSSSQRAVAPRAGVDCEPATPHLAISRIALLRTPDCRLANRPRAPGCRELGVGGPSERGSGTHSVNRLQ